jgi:2-polyprenyl-6-hydroxyphenyl methylase/3-demethylubiquinone-9 3-methyltransferase
MLNYYSDKLSAERLRRCYELATSRVRQYLEAEIDFVRRKIQLGDWVLEMGCGYGRIIPRLAVKSGLIVGIDTSYSSIMHGRNMIKNINHCHLLVMNAVQLGFPDQTFDRVICIQNGISAVHVDLRILIREAVRVVKPGGSVFFSSYADEFWPFRLEWFKQQADAGLVGEIDYEKTGNGVIVCKDGFTATTVRPQEFQEYAEGTKAEIRIEEVDQSSVFYEIIPQK